MNQATWLEGWPSGDGDMAACVRAHDWPATPLGSSDTWPDRLRGAVELMLRSPLVSTLAVGPERLLLYNDAAAALYGDRHPEALGRPLHDTWPEGYSTAAPLYERAFAGEAVHVPAQPLDVSRAGGEMFDVYLTPVRDTDGAVLAVHMTGFEVGARFRAEAALRASEERYRQLFERMDQGFCLIERLEGPSGAPSDYRYLVANPAFERHAGLRDPVGRTLRELVPDVEAAIVDIYDHVARTGEPQHFERHVAALDLWIEAEAVPADGPGRVAVLFSNVSDRKRAEAVLRKSEERSRAIVETATDYAILTTDVEGRVETWSKGAEEVLGWPASEIVGEMMDVFFTPEDRAGGRPERERRIAREEGQAPDVRWHLRRDGSRVFIDGVVRPLSGPDGAVTGFVKVGQDVTERHTAAEALSESEARFRNMADHAPVMMWVTVASGRCTYLNNAWYEFTGQTPDEAEGFGWLDATHPDDKAEAARVFVAANAKAEPFRLEYRLRRHDGDYRWAIDAAAPRFGSEGEFGGYIGSVVDIHERKLGEEVLERRVTEAVAERARAEELLRQSQKMEAMGNLTGGVAHDFNNLLTPILGSLDRLVSRGVGSERERRLIAGALESAERAKTLVQRLLAFARRQPLQPVAVDVGALVEGMAELIGSTLGPAIVVQVDVAHDLPPARTDPNQLEMALLNLAVNARDAMPEGGRLTLTASRKSLRGEERAGSGLKQGHYVQLTVADTGIGMDEATLARAVEPFFSTKGIGQGTGLGLSMAHGLAAQLGGGLTIQSQPGHGTTVELWLPISTEPLANRVVSPRAQPAAAPRGRALLVDDEVLVRLSIADMLEEQGFVVMEAASAEEALRRLLEGATIDLLVTDHLMPGMSGAELAREVIRQWPQLPILIVSGYAEAEGLPSDLPRLVKPFRAAELAERVGALMPGVAPAR